MNLSRRAKRSSPCPPFITAIPSDPSCLFTFYDTEGNSDRPRHCWWIITGDLEITEDRAL